DSVRGQEPTKRRPRGRYSPVTTQGLIRLVNLDSIFRSTGCRSEEPRCSDCFQWFKSVQYVSSELIWTAVPLEEGTGRCLPCFCFGQTCPLARARTEYCVLLTRGCFMAGNSSTELIARQTWIDGPAEAIQQGSRTAFEKVVGSEGREFLHGTWL